MREEKQFSYSIISYDFKGSACGYLIVLINSVRAFKDVTVWRHMLTQNHWHNAMRTFFFSELVSNLFFFLANNLFIFRSPAFVLAQNNL